MLFAEVHVPVPVTGPFTYSVPADMAVQPGCRVRVEFGRQKLVGYVVAILPEYAGEYKLKPLLECLDEEPVFDENLVRLAQLVSAHYMCTLGEVLQAAIPSARSSTVRASKKKLQPQIAAPVLSAAQQKIFDDIRAATAQGRLHHLLYGITGSGKTEIYITLALDCLARGQSVLYLVPEISLSSQIFSRLQAVFGETLLIYHSGLSPNRRLAAWKQFAGDQPRVLVGTRSAVFAQCRNPGLVIVDEEHDSSYKENSSPRYNARRVALFRSRLSGCVVLFGSATPSVESYYAAEQGVFILHELKERFGGAILPAIEIRKLEGTQTAQILSSQLRMQTMQSIKDGRQVIFLLNRRGFAPFVICGGCKKVVECPHCSIGLCLHQGGRLVCHYCGYEQTMPHSCPSCSNKTLDRVGAGTQRIEEVIAGAFPSCAIRRLDSDVSRRRGEADELIQSMTEGKVDILLGTQMIAKGLDFEGVDLVCVLQADIGLHMPDYRAVERVFSLLMQVAGRSGRRGSDGKVVIQTVDPENPVFDFVRRHDYEGFYRREVELRQALRYPPFCRLVRLLARSADESLAVKAIESLAEALRPGLPAECHLMGPAAAPLKKIADNYRYHILLKTSSLEALRPVLRHALDETNVNGVYIEVDVDPADVL